MKDRQPIENHIKTYLKARGKTQLWLANQAKIDTGQLSRIIQDKSAPTLITALRIAKALHTPVEVLWRVREVI